MTLDIENPDQLISYLQARGILAPGRSPEAVQTLSGGVSNKTVYVELSDNRRWVIKQCLPKLRVAVDWFSSPERIHREALALTHLPAFTPPGTIPEFVFEDRDLYLLAMRAVPQPHENWKQVLLKGQLQTQHVVQFGTILAGIHRGSHRDMAHLIPLFGDRTFFETLRIEPYYQFTASQLPAAASCIDDLIVDTRAVQHCLVHGDYSPKNILVYQDQLILLDHEVIHIGDPAFDLGFSITHLLSKAHHVAEHRSAFAQAVKLYWSTYKTENSEVINSSEFEKRAVRHVLACMLARVAGRSPLEYLTPEERNRQRDIVLTMMTLPPKTVAGVVDEFITRLGEAEIA